MAYDNRAGSVMRTGRIRKRDRVLAVLRKVKVGRPSGTEAEAGSGASSREAAEAEVWIEPISPDAKRQTLLQKRRIGIDGILIGRRGSILEASDGSSDSYLISQVEPYTISKQQCRIEIREGRVWVRDLGSRYGTRVDRHRFRSSRDKVAEVRLEPGEYLLVPGKADGRFRFKLTVR